MQIKNTVGTGLPVMQALADRRAASVGNSVRGIVFTGIAFVAVALTGCAHNPQFSGQSVTDAVLRTDVLGNVQQLFVAMTQCGSISNVDTTIASIEQSPAGSIIKAVETWQVSGCGTSKSYKVELRSDARGETDFSVSSKG